jgi:hypothetical protein
MISTLTVAIIRDSYHLVDYKWAVPYLLVLIIVLVGSAIVSFALAGHTSRKSLPEPALPPLQANTQIVKLDASPQIHNTVIVGKDAPQPPERTKAQQHDYETAKKVVSESGPRVIAVLRFVRRHGEVRFGVFPPVQLPGNIGSKEMQSILDDLTQKELVSRRDIHEPGNPQSVYDIAAPMKVALEEILYEES